MRTATIFAISLLIPASLLAGVGVSISVSDDDFYFSFESHDDYCCHGNHYESIEYRVEGEPWFEDCRSEGFTKVSFEYQWAVRGTKRVLVYRKIRFNTISHAWAFGPWLVEKHVHHHHYHPPARSSRWRRYRRYDGGKVSYYYEYTRPQYRHSRHPRVYRYEYRPEKNRNRRYYHGRRERRHFEYHGSSYQRKNSCELSKSRKYDKKEYRAKEKKHYKEYKKPVKRGRKKNIRHENGMTVVSGRRYIR
ncbi:MAG: hypothetical protein ACLFVQ_11520 [Chitinispirillaceae bacterium]